MSEFFSELFFVVNVAALIVFFITACKVSMLLREQRTTNELLRTWLNEWRRQ